MRSGGGQRGGADGGGWDGGAVRPRSYSALYALRWLMHGGGGGGGGGGESFPARTLGGRA
jgi:hypothetical protein